jgi:tRNA A37 threonylcarbamoyladenosine dehydratase
LSEAPLAASAEAPYDARRFGGVARLLGEPAVARLRTAHVVVVGIGGVGSWTAEALARSGVGALTLIDLDHVAESNLNRQVLALESTIGAAKAEVMARRIADIAPDCRVRIVEDFVTPENCAALLPAEGIVVDAIDAPRAKAAMIALCRARKQPILVCGGAGAVRDAFSLRRGDLARTRGDALLASVRARLRREHGFTRESGRAFGVQAVYFEAQRVAGQLCAPEAGAPLACAGYGSLVTVTAALGFAVAGLALDLAIAERAPAAGGR